MSNYIKQQLYFLHICVQNEAASSSLSCSALTHLPLLSAWKSPCCLHKETLTLLIKTSTTQRWNAILVELPPPSYSFFPSFSPPLPLLSSFSSVLLLSASLSLRPLTRTVPLFDLCSFYLLSLQVLKELGSGNSLFIFYFQPTPVAPPLSSLAALPGETSKIGHKEPSWPCYEFSS